MMEEEFVRVSSSANQVPLRNVKSDAGINEVGGRVNALEADGPGSMKQTLNAVVEVPYTTVKLKVAR